MKVIDLKRGRTKIQREHIQKFGEAIYSDPEVRHISIKVSFKDGSHMGFYRDEDEEVIEKLLKDDDDE